MTLETGPSSSEISSSQRDRQLDLLRVVCCVAWADGDVSADEKRLLEKLVAKYFPCGDGSGQTRKRHFS